MNSRLKQLSRKARRVAERVMSTVNKPTIGVRMSDIEEGEAAQRIAESLCPADQRVELRPLPYPFRRWMSVASDCDNPRMEGILAMTRRIRERHLLPIADSFFPQWLCRFGERRDSPHGFSREQFEAACFEWLRYFHDGGFDTVHGWLTRIRIRIGDDFALYESALGERQLAEIVDRGLGGNHALPRGLEASGRSHQVSFRDPAGWHFREPPRYLLFSAYLPVLGTELQIVFSWADKTCTVSTEELLQAGGRMAPTSMVIDLATTLEEDPRQLEELEISFRLLGQGPAIVLGPSLLSATRADIVRQMTIMQHYNVRAEVYTSHGGGYDIGRRQALELSAVDRRGQAEDSRNPHFALDLLHDFGVRYFNTANNTSQEKPLDINRLAFPFVLNRGGIVCDFHRFLSRSEALGEWLVEGGASNPSMAEFFGRQLRYLLQDARDDWSGGVIYTHNIARSPQSSSRFDFSDEQLTTEDTEQALVELARLHYGDVPDDERVWVAPTFAVLRLSRLVQTAPPHLRYERHSNVVRVRPWTDPATGATVPAPGRASHDLAGLSLYVDDAAGARVVTPDDELLCIARHPADGSGRESITVVDDSAPVPVLGRVPLASRTGFGHQVDGLTLSDERNRVRLDRSVAHLSLRPESLTIAGAHSLLLDLHTSAALELRCDLITADGQRVSVASAGFDDVDGAWALLPGQTSPYVVPLALMTAARSSASSPTIDGSIEEIRLHLQAEPGVEVEITRLWLLRDLPARLSDELLLGGRIDPELRLQHVEVRWRDQRLSHPVAGSGYYILTDRIPAGSCVEVWAIDTDDRRHAPLDGCSIELLSDRLDVDFTARGAISSSERS